MLLGDIELSLAPCPALGRACKTARNGILDRSLISFLGFSRRSDRSLRRLHGGVPFQPYGTGCRSAKIAAPSAAWSMGTLGRKRSRNHRPPCPLAQPCRHARPSAAPRSVGEQCCPSPAAWDHVHESGEQNGFSPSAVATTVAVCRKCGSVRQSAAEPRQLGQ